MRQLVRKLDSETDSWRDKIVFFWDNARTHANDTTLKLLEKLNVQVLYTGAHSFAASPIELLFSALKATDMNPQRMKMGKQ